MRVLRRSLILVHRCLGIALCLLFVVWFVSGIAMVYVGGMPRLTPQVRLARMPPLDLARVRLTPSDAASHAELRQSPGRAVLLTVLDRPAYRFPGARPATVFADTGDLLGEIGEAESLRIAGRFMGLPISSLRHVRVLDTADQWTIAERGRMPLHKIEVADSARTELYVSEELGEVAMQTTRGGRALAWAAAIPHWFYITPLRENDALWALVVVWTSGLGIVSALVGLVLGITQLRVKYAGWMRWHYVTGVVFGVFTLTWVLSGFLSMEPIEWFSRGNRGRRIPQALTGGPLELDRFPAIDARAWERVFGGGRVKEIELRRIQDEPYYYVRGPEPGPLLVAVNPLRIRREPFSVESIVERAKNGYPGAPVADAQLLSDYDAYYYDRDREAPLPVVRVKFGDADGTWVYVDGMSQFLTRFTRRRRVERWLYHGFHSLDFPFLYFNRPLWDVVVIVLCGGGAGLSAIGVVIGFKRLRRLASP